MFYGGSAVVASLHLHCFYLLASVGCGPSPARAVTSGDEERELQNLQNLQNLGDATRRVASILRGGEGAKEDVEA